MTWKMYQAFSRFSGQFKGHVCSQENGVGEGLGTRLAFLLVFFTLLRGGVLQAIPKSFFLFRENFFLLVYIGPPRPMFQLYCVSII